jgi:adenylosuccinate lyase
VTLERTLAIEKDTHHDIMAMVKAMAEQAPTHGGFVHYGATSQDINDTVLALQLTECRNELVRSCRAVRRELTRIAVAHRDTACIGRTHGQHAIPVTMGFKFANFLYELTEAQGFLERVKLLGKFHGAVGTFASLGGSDAVKRLVMKELGLTAAPITTQVVSRLHLADFAFALSAMTAALERLGKEVRNLQRTEVSELMEGFGAKQVGSSTMPQKRNPHKSERICGLARVVRAQVQPLLETVALEHERDLTNSSLERIVLPTAVVLCHYCLVEAQKLLEQLTMLPEGMERNLLSGGGRQVAERIMMALADKLGRQEAHELLRTTASEADFEAALRTHPTISESLSSEELTHLLDPRTYTGRAGVLVDEIVAEYGESATADAETAAAASAATD